MVSPDGIKYWMDWLTYKPYRKVGFAQPGFGGVARRVAMMMVSRVEDRFGNSLSYSYDANGDLASIQASDGRKLVLSYEPWQPYGVSQPSTRIRTAVLSANDAPSRTWTYTYSSAQDSPSNQRLTAVVQPDGSAWSFNLGALRFTGGGAAPIIKYRSSDGCLYDIENTTSSLQGSIVHPSGLVGEFNLKFVMRGSSYVPYRCSTLSGGAHSLDIANARTVAAVDQIKISGPGVAAQVRSYKYSPANQSWAKDCVSGCATSVWTEVTDPSGKVVRYTYSNRYDVSEGQLLRKDYYSGASGSAVVRAEEYAYAAPTAGPWPSRIGTVRQPNVNNAQLEQLAPTSKSVVVQDGVTFVRAIGEFDSFARPVRITRSNSLGNSRVDANEYHDNSTLWVLGQTAKVTCVAPAACTPSWAPTGIVVSETTYDTLARPVTAKAYGKLQQTLTYNADGTLKTAKDGNSNVTTFGSWKRGIPQSITYADSTTQSAVVNDHGWIDSVTDENGYKTCYTFDAMGRLASLTPPSETAANACDTTEGNWKKTLLSFQPVAVAEYGIPAGHWRQTVSTGAGQKITYFDALWRPLVTKELDATNGTTETLTKRFQRFTYDADGRVTFASYPGTTDALATGTWTEYDALGRVTSVSQDSELGLLTTTTQYLGDATSAYVRTVSPRGVVTVTRHQAFDQPSYDTPVLIDQGQNLAERVGIDITRDVFGKVLSIRKRNAAGTLAVTRSYAYNANQELCRSVEPETGATLMGYDGAGNLAWSAAGLPATTACEANGTSAAVLARKAARTYDARNRVKTLVFPDGRGNTTNTYAPDGLLASTAVDNDGTNVVTTTYGYNRRRLPISERMQWGSIDWSIGYAYTALGHLASQTYPNTGTVAFAPNALGQPTQAGTYATGVQYHPNGGMKQFTYGNGIVHTMTQNARQLPARSTDSNGVLDLGYAYDKHANVTGITDYTTGARQSRAMIYNGLDQLLQTTGASFGVANYSYNVLDNLTTLKVTGGSHARDHTYHYDASNRLTSVTNTVGGATVTGLSYDVQGNLANKNGQVFNFDFGNRLRGVNGVASYVYDGHGRRVRDYTTASKYSLYSQSGQLVFDSDARAGKSSQYVYLGGSLVAVREVAGSVTTVKYQHTDALGTPIAVTDAAKGVLQRSEYEPYGRLVNRPLTDGPGFTGHVQDAATGLTYMQQRYYDPLIGRFLSVDPVTPYSGGIASFNRYWYASGNPYRYKDPDGRKIMIVSQDGVSMQEAYTFMAHLSTTSEGMDAMQALERLPFYVSITFGDEYGFNPNEDEIFINPRMGMEIISTGEVQPPLVNGFHEIIHAVKFYRDGPVKWKEDMMKPEIGKSPSGRPVLGNAPEEVRATKQESKVADELKVPSRRVYQNAGELVPCKTISKC